MSLDGQILDNVTLTFIQTLNSHAYRIQEMAQGLFMYLAIIQVSITGLMLVVQGDTLRRLLVELVKLSVTLGLLYGCITHASTWIPQLINGFIDIGKVSGLASLDPSSIINQGASISGAILKGLFKTGLLRHPFVSLIGASVCISIIVIYAFIAAELTIMLVKSYFLVAIGSLFFAFGGLTVGRALTKNYINAIIGLGLKLMTLYLLLGIGQSIGQDWASTTEQAAKNHQLMPMLVILAAVIVYYMILKNIPAFVAQLSGIGGFHNYGDAAIGTAITAGMSGANGLMRAQSLAASGVQAGAQGIRGAGAITKVVGQGYGAASSNNPLGKLSGGFTHAGKHAALSTMKSIKETALKQNQGQSFGQKFNHHLRNTIKEEQS